MLSCSFRCDRIHDQGILKGEVCFKWWLSLSFDVVSLANILPPGEGYRLRPHNKYFNEAAPGRVHFNQAGSSYKVGFFFTHELCNNLVSIFCSNLHFHSHKLGQIFWNDNFIHHCYVGDWPLFFVCPLHLFKFCQKITRSAKANKILSNLNAVLSTFSPTKLELDCTNSNYAAGNRWCRRSPTQDQRSIQELLLEDIQIQQEKNHQLGKKNDQIVKQVETLKQQASNAYDPPTVRLSQSPIMSILTKTVAMYMFLRHLNNPREENEL